MQLKAKEFELSQGLGIFAFMVGGEKLQMFYFIKRLFVQAAITFILTFPFNAMAQNTTTVIPPEWRTFAEKTDYRETPRYEETLAYSRKLDDASRLIRMESFGQSGEGRSLPLLIVAEGETFTPEAARRAGKVVILVQACIHPGEPDGKDAGLALLRDIAITKTRTGLLDHIVLLFMPIFNVDGHERSSPYNRINQNGPAEMGWRGTSANINLNRDYMKADTPEMRSWLKLWANWNPDLFIDCHVTDGADYQYNLTYQFEHHGNVPAPVLAWERTVFEGKIVPATEAAGNILSPYLEFRDNRDLTKGIDSFLGPPRFSTGYTPVRNRPGLLLETHMLKDYRSRVLATYDLLRFTLEEVNRDPQSLLRAVRQADEQTIAEGKTYDPSKMYPLQFELTDKAVPFHLKGVESHTEMSDVSGDVRVVFGTKPIDLTVPLYDEVRVTAQVPTPLYYIVPPQWKDVITVLTAHGLKLQRLAEATTIEVESYRFSEAKWADAPFEGRVMMTFKTGRVREKRMFPAGSVLVPLAQPAAHVAMHLLEPEGPDSFVPWGFFNAIFEQKEYGESYVLEKLAREMLRDNPELRREFEKRLMDDPAFAASSRARLNFFYQRSPYWDQQMNLYPVGRITSNINLKLKDF